MKRAKPNTAHQREKDLEDILNSIWAGKSKLPIVEILWEDAVSVGGLDWATPEEATENTPAKSVSLGYLWNETETHITIIALINDTHVAHGITIPKPWIKKIKQIKTN